MKNICTSILTLSCLYSLICIIIFNLAIIINLHVQKIILLKISKNNFHRCKLSFSCLALFLDYIF